MAARALVTLTESNLVVFFDPNVIIANVEDKLLNQNGSITVHFPDTSTLDFFGYLRTFELQDHEEGAPPEANISITPTNFDPINNVEAGPVLTTVANT